jgi:hypothetical protein
VWRFLALPTNAVTFFTGDLLPGYLAVGDRAGSAAGDRASAAPDAVATQGTDRELVKELSEVSWSAARRDGSRE